MKIKPFEWLCGIAFALLLVFSCASEQKKQTAAAEPKKQDRFTFECESHFTIDPTACILRDRLTGKEWLVVEVTYGVSILPMEEEQEK